MDVDKERIAIAVVKDYESEPRLQRVIRNRADAVKELVEGLSRGYDQVTMCYQAEACGFELYRRMTDLGALCVVIAPASLPKKANDRIKTDLAEEDPLRTVQGPGAVPHEILGLLQTKGTQLMRRYGLYSSRTKGRWEEMDHVAERAPHGWRAEHELSVASDQEALGFSPMSDSEEGGPTARKSAWARLLAGPTPVGRLLRSIRLSAQSAVRR